MTILALHLNYGGIERFITTLANSICDAYNVEIISTYKMNDKPFFELNKNVKVKYLINNLKPNKHLLKKYLKKLEILNFFKELSISVRVLHYKKHNMIKYIKKCDSDIIISTRDIHNKWLGKYGKNGIIKIASEHNDTNSSKYINKIAKTVKKLDYLVVVSNKMKSDYDDILNIPVVCIPNSIETLPDIFSKLNSKNIISVGRLEKVKGYDDLIDVFKIINALNKDIVLNIVGSGNEMDNLKAKVKELNLDNNINLLGYKNSNELSKLYNNSSIYVMTSHSESFGLVLIEAMSHRLPCIAFDSARGATEIIEDGVNGYLIENRSKENMAKKILELINNRDKLSEMGDAACINSKEYLSSNTKQKWVDLFEKK